MLRITQSFAALTNQLTTHWGRDFAPLKEYLLRLCNHLLIRLNRGTLNLAKLNLYQCLAVAGPHYEHMFCLGEHSLHDTGQCLVAAGGGVGSERAAVETAAVATEPRRSLRARLLRRQLRFDKELILPRLF